MTAGNEDRAINFVVKTLAIGSNIDFAEQTGIVAMFALAEQAF